MFEKNKCEINEKNSEAVYDVCSRLSVVDAAKSDMEYNCSGCDEL